MKSESQSLMSWRPTQHFAGLPEREIPAFEPVVLAVDPGLCNIGVAVFSTSGELFGGGGLETSSIRPVESDVRRIPVGVTLSNRALSIADFLLRFVEHLNVARVVIELPYSGGARSSTAAFGIGLGFGIAVGLVRACGCTDVRGATVPVCRNVLRTRPTDKYAIVREIQHRFPELAMSRLNLGSRTALCDAIVCGMAAFEQPSRFHALK